MLRRFRSNSNISNYITLITSYSFITLRHRNSCFFLRHCYTIIKIVRLYEWNVSPCTWQTVRCSAAQVSGFVVQGSLLQLVLSISTSCTPQKLAKPTHSFADYSISSILLRKYIQHITPVSVVWGDLKIDYYVLRLTKKQTEQQFQKSFPKKEQV